MIPHHVTRDTASRDMVYTNQRVRNHTSAVVIVWDFMLLRTGSQSCHLVMKINWSSINNDGEKYGDLLLFVI